jgi:hypothetical protein
MNNTTATARNIQAAKWNTPTGVLGFQSSRCFGVVNAEGLMLSTDGITPATWGTLATAKIVAEHLTTNPQWVAAV